MPPLPPLAFDGIPPLELGPLLPPLLEPVPSAPEPLFEHASRSPRPSSSANANALLLLRILELVFIRNSETFSGPQPRALVRPAVERKGGPLLVAGQDDHSSYRLIVKERITRRPSQSCTQ